VSRKVRLPGQPTLRSSFGLESLPPPILIAPVVVIISPRALMIFEGAQKG
jgi:hypothetical protein